MACVSMDMSDPTARSLCFGCGASWTIETDAPCPDCGASLVSRERVLREFAGSVRDREASLPELSSLELLCTTKNEDEQRHVRDRLAENDVAHFCFGEQRAARDGSPAPTTSFYIADLHLEWARDHLADFFHGGGSVLLARAVNDFEASIYRAALDDRGIGYTTSRLTRQYPIMIGTETIFFVAEVDVEAARQAIENAVNADAPPISAQELAGEAVPGIPPADETEPDQEESSASSTGGSVVPEDASRRLQDLQDGARYSMTRFLFLVTAILDLVLGPVYFAIPVPIPFLSGLGPLLGVLCLFFVAGLVALGRWSRQDPETAFGWSLPLLILNVAAIVPGFQFFGLVPLVVSLVSLFSWRRARERRLEGPVGD